MKRNLHAGRLGSGGLSLSVFTADEMEDIHLATLEVLAAHRRLRRGRRGAGALCRRRLRHRRRAAHREDPAASWSKTRSPARRPSSSSAAARRAGTWSSSPAASASPTSARASRSSTRRRGELREPTKADVAGVTRVIDALDEIDVVERPVGSGDVDQALAPLHNAEAIFSNTTKHVFIGPINGKLLRYILRMAAAVVGGPEKLRERPLVSFITCPVSPLKLVRDCCEIIMESARGGAAVQHPLHGHGRRLLAGHPGRHAGDPQRRGAGRHHAGAADQARRPGALRLVDDGHGPAARLGLRRQRPSAP